MKMNLQMYLYVVLPENIQLFYHKEVVLRLKNEQI